MGDSVKWIPLVGVQKICDLKILPTMTTLQMTDNTSRKLVRIIKEVMIKIDKLSFFFIDFMVLDVEKYSKIPLILGRRFTNTARMLVDIDKCQVKERIKDHEVYFHMISIT